MLHFQHDCLNLRRTAARLATQASGKLAWRQSLLEAIPQQQRTPPQRSGKRE
jgi:hypothetical protein